MINEITKKGTITQVRAQTLGVNAYIIEQKDFLFIIDSLLLPSDAQELSHIAEKFHKPLKYLINTHFHSDHCRGNRYLKKDNTIQINHKDYWNTITSERSMLNPKKYRPVDRKSLTEADILIDSNYKLNDDIELIPTPGHSPDSISIFLPKENSMITGDTVLSNTSGTYSLPYFYWGNINDLKESYKKILNISPQTIYSGHGYPLNGTDKVKTDLQYLINLENAFNEYKKNNDIAKDTEIDIPIKSCLPIEQRIAVPQVHKYNIQRLLKANR